MRPMINERFRFTDVHMDLLRDLVNFLGAEDST